MNTTLPYLTSELPGIGGEIKQRPDDFRVDEIPLYPAAGEGSHIYFQIRKWGLPTHQAVNRLAQYLKVRPSDIGMAGLKDAQAITTQWLSLEYGDEKKLRHFQDPKIEVLQITKHRNKLKTGHLAGNRFTIRLRGVGKMQQPAAQAILDVLAKRGVPNYFGHQRFGMRNDADQLGRALLANDLDEFLAIFLGRPHPEEALPIRLARQAFDRGDYSAARQHWPKSFSDQRKALAAYQKKRNPDHAINAIDRRMNRLFVSAFQSAIFNDILAERIDSIDTILPGEMAQKIDSGGIFLVEDLAAEQLRCDAFEISPTGPLPGSRCRLAEADAGKIEQAILQKYKLSANSFGKVGSLSVKGTRRPLRFKLDQLELSAGEDQWGEYLELQFAAPSGCYATVVLDEITKTRTAT